MDISALHEALIKEPKFRYKQANQAVFIDLITNWQEATNLSLALREKLNECCPLDIQVELSPCDEMGARKALVIFADGQAAETVLIPQASGNYAVCLSSMVGCPLGCLFCATGQNGFSRNLKAEEMVDQFLFWARYLKNLGEGKIDNVVFMGMGEPFLNYSEVLKAVKIFNNPETFNFGARRISISTAGMIDGIKRLATEKIQINLAISLHAPNDQLRVGLMPLAGKTSIKNLLAAVDNYIAKTGRKVMFEYLLIKNVNDHDEEARSLATLMKKPLYHVNLIPYNPTGRFSPSTPERSKRFKEILEQAGVAVTFRRSFGRDIDAACGQLAGKRKKL